MRTMSRRRGLSPLRAGRAPRYQLIRYYYCDSLDGSELPSQVPNQADAPSDQIECFEQSQTSQSSPGGARGEEGDDARSHSDCRDDPCRVGDENELRGGSGSTWNIASGQRREPRAPEGFGGLPAPHARLERASRVWGQRPSWTRSRAKVFALRRGSTLRAARSTTAWSTGAPALCRSCGCQPRVRCSESRARRSVQSCAGAEYYGIRVCLAVTQKEGHVLDAYAS